MNLQSFLKLRWHGHLPWRRALLIDMLMVGTGINVFTTLLALITVALKMPIVLSALVFFAPLPYNLLLLRSVWLASTKSLQPLVIRSVALSWTAVATLV
jgi:hypothetical protein